MIKMMMRQTYRNDCIILKTLEDLVPKEHLVRKLDTVIDLSFIEDEAESLYSTLGKPSIPPMVLFKLLIINYIFGINSMRKTCEECKVNIAYRWYLGLSIDDKIPDYSTWSQNYIRRYRGTKIFDTIFKKILKQAMKYKMVEMKIVFGDGTHQKASANKNKYQDVEVEIEAKSYDEQLLKEINELRKELKKKPFENIEKIERDFDEETGEEIEIKKKKHIKASITDPGAGYYHKGEHEKCFAYTHQAFSDENGFVVACSTNPGNMHDSVAFEGIFEELMEKYKDEIDNICLDSGYNTPAICKKIEDSGKEALMPYSRPKGRKDKEIFSKKEYEYNKELDCYVCPIGEILELKTVDKQGYKIYKSNRKSCATCPLKEKCTKSKNNQKVITRHIWQNQKDEVNNRRYENKFKEEYPKRKQTVERIFADCKEQHGLRYSRVRGLEKNSNQALLIFACHNLKKMALWRTKNNKKRGESIKNNICNCILSLIRQTKRALFNNNTLLSTV